MRTPAGVVPRLANSRDYITMRCVQSSAVGKHGARCRHDDAMAGIAAPVGVRRDENGTRAGTIARPRAHVPSRRPSG